jgi:hypothetical protein
MKTTTKPVENLTATISFRLTDNECYALAVRADREQRTLSQLVRLLLRGSLQQSGQDSSPV